MIYIYIYILVSLDWRIECTLKFATRTYIIIFFKRREIIVSIIEKKKYHGTIFQEYILIFFRKEVEVGN